MKNVAVIILTYNEARHLERAIRSVEPFAAEVVVVDSFSTDETVEIAHRCGAIVFQRHFTNYANQFQWALDNIAIKSPWIMRLDADEIIEAELSERLCGHLTALSKDVVGVNLMRKHIFMGRWIRHGGRYPLVLLRIWRRNYGRIENRWMDEHMIVWGGKTVTLNGGFADHNLNDLTFFIEKHNRYAVREALDVLNQEYCLFETDAGVSAMSTSWQAAFKRRIKEKIYNHLPFPIGAFAYFSHRYVLQLGFLDGRPGLIYHVLQGFWYRFLVGAKVLELRNAIAHLDDKVEIASELSRITGHQISVRCGNGHRAKTTYSMHESK